jgi:hypothetical protein
MVPQTLRKFMTSPEVLTDSIRHYLSGPGIAALLLSPWSRRGVAHLCKHLACRQ